MNSGARNVLSLSAAAVMLLAGGVVPHAIAQDGPPGAAEPKKDFPPFAEVSKDYTKVVSTTDGEPPLYGVWTREKDQQMLLELPRDFARQRHYMAMTVSTGEAFAGLQGPALYFYWKRYDKRLALIQPQITVRSTGDAESKIGVERVFTDRVVLDVPIVCMGPNGGPVIDGDALFVGQMGQLFGPGAGGNPALATIKKAKAFPKNVELAFELPTPGGLLKSFHYSISLIPDSTGYTPRDADERVGYFQTWFRDLGKFKDDDKWVRYIHRWNLQKADPKLKKSQPKEAIKFYIEYTVPVRYRRFIRDGILYWNKAFEQVGIVDAIQVSFQDKSTGENMDKDPEDVRYNFIRWVTNDIATAIGPSRAHPLTGEILDADIVLTDGWIRAFWSQSNEIIPDIAMRGMSAEEIAWLDSRPQWDPRVRLAPVADRDAILAKRLASRGIARFGGVAAGDGEAAESLRRTQTTAWNCLAAQGKAFDMSVARVAMEIAGYLDEAQPETPAADGDKKKDDKKSDDKKDDKPDLLDGIPEWFIAQALADLTAHELGHTLGLRHNFKASSAYSLKQINSDEFKGKKPFATSVMDYNPININVSALGDKSQVQGDYNMIDIGKYDLWAIEYGYGSGDTKKVAQRAADPELQYGSDEDAGGIDAAVRRYDLSSDPRDYAIQRMDLAKYARGRILEKFVKDGQSWAKARRGYAVTLNMQADGLSIMTNWVGAASIRKDRKGDPNGRPPLEPYPVTQQRAALKFVIENAFVDEAFGLTPDLLSHMTIDRFEDPGAGRGDPDWPVHDMVAGVQASVLSGLINPVRLRRVYDNEFRIPRDQDALTLPEMLDTVVDSIWSEVGNASGGTARKPAISSLRRDLQRECLERLIDLSVEGGVPGEAGKAITSLVSAKLRDLRGKLDSYVKGGSADPYTKAHLVDAAKRIDKALDAQYISNMPAGGMGGMSSFIFGQPANAADPLTPPAPGSTTQPDGR